MGSLPQTFSLPQSAYEPGRSTVIAKTREWISVPRCLMVAAIILGMREYLKPPSTKVAEQTQGCNTKYCQEIFVDAPRNTLLKDQSLRVGLGMPKQLPGPKTVYRKIKNDLYDETVRSPGVQLVAKAVETGTAYT